MIARIPNLTDISISRLTNPLLPKPPNPPSRNLSISNLHPSNPHRRTISQSQPRTNSHSNYYSHKPSGIQLRENQLLWMFNRRKAKLRETSVANFRLYNRIKAQKSQLGRYNVGGRVSKCEVVGQGRVYTEPVEADGEENKENYDKGQQGEEEIGKFCGSRYNDVKNNLEILDYIKKKQSHIEKLLRRNTYKQWHKFNRSYNSTTSNIPKIN